MRDFLSKIVAGVTWFGRFLIMFVTGLEIN